MNPASVSSPAPPRPTRHRVASAISYVLNPLLWPPLLVGLLLGGAGAPPAELGRAVGLAVVFFSLTPLGYLVYLLRHRRIDTVEVRRQDRRTAPYLVGLAGHLLGWGALALTLTTARAVVLPVVGTLCMNLLLMLSINRRLKLSAHVAGLAGFFAVLLYAALASLPAAFPGTAVLPLLGGLLGVLSWARVRTGAHTRAEVAAGLLFGLFVPLLELLLLQRAGLLAGP